MFDGVTRDDIGRYTCVATNEQGAIDVSIFVDVVGKLVDFSSSKTSFIFRKKSSDEFDADQDVTA